MNANDKKMHNRAIERKIKELKEEIKRLKKELK